MTDNLDAAESILSKLTPRIGDDPAQGRLMHATALATIELAKATRLAALIAYVDCEYRHPSSVGGIPPMEHERIIREIGDLMTPPPREDTPS